MRRVGRDGRLSYRGTRYQLPLTQAKSTIDVREGGDGQVTLRAGKGQVIRGDVVDAHLLASAIVPVAPTVEPPPAPRLTIVYPEAPAVDVRDLALDEEVANAASRA